jgi:hypothetical protein
MSTKYFGKLSIYVKCISFTASPPRAATYTPPTAKYQPKKTSPNTSFPQITLAKSMYINWFIDW